MPDDFVMGGDWGPWSPHASDRERLCAAVVLRLLASIILGRTHPLTRALRRAEEAGDDAIGMVNEALAEAAQEMERLPARDRRKLMCTYGNHQRRETPEGARRRPGRYEKAEKSRTKQSLADGAAA